MGSAMNNIFMQKKKNNKKVLLTAQAKKQGCLEEIELRNLYPNPESELTLWIRNNKNGEERNEKKSRISVYLSKLEFNNNYSIGLFTFLNKHTENTFQLDIKYYGKLWWAFR